MSLLSTVAQPSCAAEPGIKRPGTDNIDLIACTASTHLTPVDETLRPLDVLVPSGKIGYIRPCFSGWCVMKALAPSEKNGLARQVAYQGYFSLAGCNYDRELMPVGLHHRVARMVWDPPGWGDLPGKLRGAGPSRTSCIAAGSADSGPEVQDEYLYTVVNATDAAADTGKSVAQVAFNRLLSRPTVSNLVLRA